MKYIRTKDGRILKGNNYDFGVGMPYKNYDVRVADNVEELFDELILVAPYRFKKPKTATELEKDFEEMKYFYTDKDDTIYGAIWSIGEHGESILKSVARLSNDRTDWKLL